ncbi:MAG: bifunctional DNA primase/polymerase, partial [Nitrospirota bacterium]
MKTTLEWAKWYVSKGFSVIPIKHKGKEPAIFSWKGYQDKLPTNEELVEWFGNNSKNNIAIVTGKISNIVA